MVSVNRIGFNSFSNVNAVLQPSFQKRFPKTKIQAANMVTNAIEDKIGKKLGERIIRSAKANYDEGISELYEAENVREKSQCLISTGEAIIQNLNYSDMEDGVFKGNRTMMEHSNDNTLSRHSTFDSKGRVKRIVESLNGKTDIIEQENNKIIVKKNVKMLGSDCRKVDKIYVFNRDGKLKRCQKGVTEFFVNDEKIKNIEKEFVYRNGKLDWVSEGIRRRKDGETVKKGTRYSSKREPIAFYEQIEHADNSTRVGKKYSIHRKLDVFDNDSMNKKSYVFSYTSDIGERKVTVSI